MRPANQNARGWQRALRSALVIVASVVMWGVVLLPAAGVWLVSGRDPIPAT
jgi:hypothetical protein